MANGKNSDLKKIFEEYKIKRTPAQWAFRWLWNQKEVTCVLSGMNSLEMVQENISAASSAEIGDLGEAEESMLREVDNIIIKPIFLRCTGIAVIKRFRESITLRFAHCRVCAFCKSIKICNKLFFIFASSVSVNWIYVSQKDDFVVIRC